MNTRTIIVVAAIGSATTIGSVLGIACSRGTSGSGGDLTQLEQDTGVRWIAVSNNTFGTTSYLYPTSTPPVALTSGMQPEAAAMAFLVQYGAVFQMVDPAHELAPEASGASSGLQFASFTLDQRSLGELRLLEERQLGERAHIPRRHARARCAVRRGQRV